MPGWNDQRSPGGGWTQYAVIPGQVDARRRNQGGKFGNEVLTLENDSSGSVAPWTFQTVVEPAIGEFRQTVRGDRGASRIAQKPFQAHPVASLHRDIGVDTEAGDHRAAVTLDGIDAVGVNPIARSGNALTGIETERNPAADGTGQQRGHTGAVL